VGDAINCPACGAQMQALEFEAHDTRRVELHFCFPCQVIWFDALQSLQLAPRGVLDVFGALNEHRTAARNPLPSLLSCPRCNSRLTLTYDLQHTTRFTYFRCGFGHGRLTPFFQFLLEKNFVRPITGGELADLKAKVRIVQCSNCGAPLDLEHDAACKYCGSPVSILDPDAVTETIRALGQADARAHTIDIDRLAEALTMQPSADSSSRGPIVGDLVGAGLAVVAAMLTRL
jgi:DNA-directed RNA polymerase subunit RPC12/RpoP